MAKFVRQIVAIATLILIALGSVSTLQLSGEILNFAPGREGGLCLAVGQSKKHLTRVYHAN